MSIAAHWLEAESPARPGEEIAMIPELTLLGIALPEWVLRMLTLLVWIVLVGIVLRVVALHGRERLRCPRGHRMAYLTLLRGHDGAIVDVVSCSLMRGKPFVCGKRCVRPVRA
jgi:hypothetical protein